ncbi:hypothetical protein A9Q83_14120 [Alphaproteobacteria bacterium 46_93_T64]|nr:hypothetical protein A9Q83_14120 [Alphaproteobacteria bacterium 46_93_T64]
MRVSSNRRPRGGRPNSGSGGRSGSSAGRGGQNNNNRRSSNGNRSYDSNGPDGKIRGSATQVYDKYISLGRDAQTASDHVGAENYYQHAEHYYRIMLANNLVKPDRSAEQSSSEDEITGTTEIEISQSDNAREKASNTDDTEVVAAAKEPIIIDLSNPDADEEEVPVSPDIEDENNAEPKVADVVKARVKVKAKAETEAETDAELETAAEQVTSEDDGEPKPKSKRRVSRTRGLRRRTSRRNTDGSENDEPQSAE